MTKWTTSPKKIASQINMGQTPAFSVLLAFSANRARAARDLNDFPKKVAASVGRDDGPEFPAPGAVQTVFRVEVATGGLARIIGVSRCVSHWIVGATRA